MSTLPIRRTFGIVICILYLTGSAAPVSAQCDDYFVEVSDGTSFFCGGPDEDECQAACAHTAFVECPQACRSECGTDFAYMATEYCEQYSTDPESWASDRVKCSCEWP